MLTKFKNNRKRRTWFSHPVTLLLLISLCVFLPNEAFCGNTEAINSTQELQEIVRAYIAEANEAELEELGQAMRNIQGPRQINPPQGWLEETNTENLSDRSVWTPVVMYVLFSTTIIVVSLYHREILNTLFDIGRDIITAVPRAAVNLVNMRTETLNLAQNLMENPAHREPLLNMMNNIITARRMGGAGVP